jgi:hypothetical protein
MYVCMYVWQDNNKKEKKKNGEKKKGCEYNAMESRRKSLSKQQERIILPSSLTNSGAEQTTMIPSSGPPPTRAILNSDNADARGDVGNAGYWVNGAGETGDGETAGGGAESQRSSVLVCVRGGALCDFFDFDAGGGAAAGGVGANDSSARGAGNYPNWASGSDLHLAVVSRAKCPSSCSRASFCSSKEARKMKRQALPPTCHAWR